MSESRQFVVIACDLTRQKKSCKLASIPVNKINENSLVDKERYVIKSC